MKEEVSVNTSSGKPVTWKEEGLSLGHAPQGLSLVAVGGVWTRLEKQNHSLEPDTEGGILLSTARLLEDTKRGDFLAEVTGVLGESFSSLGSILSLVSGHSLP